MSEQTVESKQAPEGIKKATVAKKVVALKAPDAKDATPSAPKPTIKESASKGKAPKEKTTVKPIKGAQLLKKGPGPAMKLLVNKFRKNREPGQCTMIGCSSKSVTKRAKWCAAHKKEIRKAQLKANNAIWKKRVKEGRAGHHIVYDGAATVFTLQNRELAERILMAGRSTLSTKKELEKAIAAVPAGQRKEARALAR